MSRHGENIRKRKDGRWEARCIIGYGRDGKACYKYLYGKTYSEVKELKQQIVAGKVVQTARTGSKQMTFDRLLNDWLMSILPDIKESTYSRYIFLIDRHIRPELGKIPLNKMSCEIIEEFSARKLREGKLNGSGGLSPKTVSCILSLIRLVLDYGVRKKYCCPNHITIKNPRQNKPEILILSTPEQQLLEKYLLEHPDPVNTGILLTLYTGLRIGEVCALKWEHFNFAGGTVSIQQTLLRIQDFSENHMAKTRIVIDRPKTENSCRIIPLPSFLLSYLESVSGAATCYILTGSESCMEPRRYYLNYKKTMKACGLERFTYHALRHTFATRCIENSFDLKSLSEILGHANVTTTMQQYVHPSMKLKRHYMDQLENISFCGQNLSHNSGRKPEKTAFTSPHS